MPQPATKPRAARMHAPNRTRDGIPRAATLEECAQELGVSRERVRQIERDALAKLGAMYQAAGISFEDFALDPEPSADDCRIE